MRILWLAPEPPLPPLSGGRERAYRMLTYLAERHSLHLVTFAAVEEEAALAELAQPSAGVTRLAYPQGHLAPLRRLLAWRRIHDVLRAFRPHAVHVQGLSLWSGIPPAYGGMRVYDCHDAPPSHSAPSASSSWANEAPEERPDAVIAVSPGDRRRLQRLYPRIPVHLVPNGVDVAYWQATVDAPEPKSVFFPGALNWPPNDEGARVLLEEIMPRLRRLVPGVRLIIAGRRPALDLTELVAAAPDATLVADPPDMRPWFARATLVLVPLQGVTGTRLKILQALAARRPVLSTPEGAQGLGLDAGRHLCLAPLGAPFVEAAAALLQDDRQRALLAEAGAEVVDRYDWQHLLPALDEVYPPCAS